MATQSLIQIYSQIRKYTNKFAIEKLESVEDSLHFC
jgi:hypothetical protein